jgi:hypothetical protein
MSALVRLALKNLSSPIISQNYHLLLDDYSYGNKVFFMSRIANLSGVLSQGVKRGS